MSLLRPTRILYHFLRQSLVHSSRPKYIRNMATSAMAKRLSGKTILITGASSGIGLPRHATRLPLLLPD